MPLLAFETSQLLIGLMVVFFLFISLCMMLIVLIQRPQGGGIAGAFGGGGAEGAGQTAFGAKTGDVLTTVTIGIFVVFIGSAIALNYVVRPPAAVDETSITAPPGEAPAVPVTSGTSLPTEAPATALSPTGAPTAPAPGTVPDADGKFRADSPAGSIESVVPIEVIPAGQPVPAGTNPSGTPEPAPAPAPAPAANPGTPPPANPQ